jgi:hypothetical protein
MPRARASKCSVVEHWQTMLNGALLADIPPGGTGAAGNCSTLEPSFRGAGERRLFGPGRLGRGPTVTRFYLRRAWVRFARSCWAAFRVGNGRSDGDMVMMPPCGTQLSGRSTTYHSPSCWFSMISGIAAMGSIVTGSARGRTRVCGYSGVTRTDLTAPGAPIISSGRPLTRQRIAPALPTLSEMVSRPARLWRSPGCIVR